MRAPRSALLALVCLARPAAATPAASFSLFEPKGKACVWSRVELPGAKHTELATFPHGCAGATAIIAPDGKTAAVWFRAGVVGGSFGIKGYPAPAYPDSDTSAAGDLWLADVGKPPTQLPPPPEKGQLQEICLGKDGALYAILLETPGDLKLEGDEGKRSFSYGGKTYAYDDTWEGLPALAHAAELKRGAKSWELVESIGTATGTEFAPGTEALKTRAACISQKPQRADQLDDELGRGIIKLHAEALKPLEPKGIAQPGVESSDGWQVYTGGVLGWYVFGDSVHPTGLLVFAAAGKVKPLDKLGYTAGDLVSMSTRESLLLVTVEGTGAHPRIYDTKAKKLLYNSDVARGAAFWP